MFLKKCLYVELKIIELANGAWERWLKFIPSTLSAPWVDGYYRRLSRFFLSMSGDLSLYWIDKILENRRVLSKGHQCSYFCFLSELYFIFLLTTKFFLFWSVFESPCRIVSSLLRGSIWQHVHHIMIYS